MKNPLISIIIPAYNAENTIATTIESALNQTYKYFELIIIDDCSKDKTGQIIDEYCKKDERIVKYSNEKNCGVAYGRNFGVSKAKGEWIAFLDNDDIWKEDKLEKQVKFLNQKNMEPILLYTGSAFVDENDKLYNYIMEVPESVSYKELLKQNIISCSSTLIKKEALERVKMEKDNAHEDFLTWLKILRDYNICAYGINEPLLLYRISRNSKSGNKVKSVKMTYIVYKCMGLNIFERMYYMGNYILRNLKKYKKINSE